MKQYQEGKTVYRLPPCPPYDVEGTEAWLTDMAREGLLLMKDGFFAGLATFEAAAPQEVKYRLEAAQKNTSMWAPDGGAPDPEQVELSERYSWEYVAVRGDFYVYRSFDPDARELNTDPEVQALALNAVRKKRRASFVWFLIWFLIYPALLTNGALLLSVIDLGTPLFALIVLLLVWMIADDAVELRSLKRLQGRLRSGEALERCGSRRSAALRYHGRRLAKLGLTLVLLALLLGHWSDSVTDAAAVALKDYTGELPFATLTDLAGGDIYNYQETYSRQRYNTVVDRSDWLAPRSIAYNEHARFRCADGALFDGLMYIDYYELPNARLARCLVKELYRTDRWRNDITLREAPAVDADLVIFYMQDHSHFPILVLQKGNITVRAQVWLYQTSEVQMTVDEWASVIADSIG